MNMLWFKSKKGINEPAVTGGGSKDNTDYNAPKEIESTKLVSFETEFFRYGDLVYNKDGHYRFTLNKSDQGTFAIAEESMANISCEALEEFAEKVDKIIRDYNLIKYNGTDKITYGLPPEYGPYWLKAQYESGEKLYFYMNGDPHAEWTRALLELYAKEMGQHGIMDLLPAREESKVKRFSIEFTDGCMQYQYGEILVPVTEEEKNREFEDLLTHGANEDDCVTMVYSDVWDRSGKAEPADTRMARLTDDYYESIHKLVEETGMVYQQNGEAYPSQFDYEGTPEYFEFYLEYESGNRIRGFSAQHEKYEEFKPVARKFADFYEKYLTDYKVDIDS